MDDSIRASAVSLSALYAVVIISQTYSTIPAPETTAVFSPLDSDDIEHAFNALLGRYYALDFPVNLNGSHIP